MNILVTLDSNYMHQLMVMLKSIESSNPLTPLNVYIIHTKLTEFELVMLARKFPQIKFISIIPDDEIFDGAHFTKRISKETYYRLLLCKYLPDSVDRILYIDPDTIVLKSLAPLYNYDFKGRCIVGAGHTHGIIEWFNLKRLKMDKGSTYINAGVMMINVDNLRKIFNLDDIQALIKKKGKLLFQADQDIINALYHKHTCYVLPEVYNLDEHTYQKKKLSCDYINKNTAIIHYDGKNKPWKADYNGSMGEYYNYFERQLNKNVKEIQYSVAN